jgi:hypothetical protein
MAWPDSNVPVSATGKKIGIIGFTWELNLLLPKILTMVTA